MVETIKGIRDKEDSDKSKELYDTSTKQIISSISHELRTPLSIISSNLQLLHDSRGELNDEIREETFMLCGEAVKSMSRFLDDIYFLNVSIKGELQKKTEKFSLKKYFPQLVKEFAFLDYEQNRIILKMKLDSDEIVTDKELLSRVLHNIINNALKFSPDKVNITVTFDGQELYIEIEDMGIGISQEDIDLIFNPFYRGQNVKMISGTGLGLPIAKKSIDCMGGELEIESKVGNGTIVKLIILNDE